jgi:hypothetical protein
MQLKDGERKKSPALKVPGQCPLIILAEVHLRGIKLWEVKRVKGLGSAHQYKLETLCRSFTGYNSIFGASIVSAALE